MAAINIRLSDEKYERLKKLAKAKNISVNKLMEELATMALAEYDLETRFKVRASRGSTEKALEVLEKLKEDYRDE